MRTPNRPRGTRSRTLLVSLVLGSALSAVACSGGPAVAPPPMTEGAPPVDPATDAKLRAALGGPQRTDAEKARDVYRHPLQTLEFMGLHDDMTVVEISPGGGWYTAVLAPVLRDKGKLIVTSADPNGDPKSEATQDAKDLQARFQSAPQAFDKVALAVVAPGQPWVLAPPESVDMVLTFRNFHNWTEPGAVERILGAALTALKHGGILGLVDHRAKAGTPGDPKRIGETGYVPQDYAIQVVEKLGFKLAGKAEINANPKDDTDHPKGVWTLPPSYQMGAQDHAKYQAIGESDRMTLRFVKP